MCTVSCRTPRECWKAVEPRAAATARLQSTLRRRRASNQRQRPLGASAEQLPPHCRLERLCLQQTAEVSPAPCTRGASPRRSRNDGSRRPGGEAPPLRRRLNVRFAPPLLVSGSGSTECCMSAELLPPRRRFERQGCKAAPGDGALCALRPTALGERQHQRLYGVLNKRGAVTSAPPLRAARLQSSPRRRRLVCASPYRSR